MQTRATLIVLLAVSLAGCSNDANLVRDAAMAAGITGGEPKPAPDFVTRTRSADVDYMPIGTPVPKRSRPKDADAVADAEAQMNGLRSRNESLGGSARRAGQTPAAKPAVAPAEE